MFLQIFNVFLFIFEVSQLIVKSAILIFKSGWLKIFPPAYKCVKSDIVLVTGAGHGLGRELCKRFAELGAKIVIWDIHKPNMEKVVEEIRKEGGFAVSYFCDVTDEVMCESVALQVRREVGDVTILVNNAGILHCLPFMNLTPGQIRRTLEVNLLGHYWTIRQFLPRMLELGRGHIVAVASVASLVGTVNMTDYCGSKFGVRGMMQALDLELNSAHKDEVIHLTTVCPLTFNTGLAKRPKSRFNNLLPIMETSEVAGSVMDAILRNKNFVVVPSRVGTALTLQDIVPKNVKHMIQKFLDYESQQH